MDRTCTCQPCRDRRWLIDWAQGKKVPPPPASLIKREVWRLAEDAKLVEEDEAPATRR